MFCNTIPSTQVKLPPDMEMIMPGDNATIDLKSVTTSGIPMEVGQRFTIRESGKTIGTGLVTAITEKADLVAAS